MKWIKEEYSKNIKKFLVLNLSFFVFSCATIQYKKAELPIVYLSEFDSCRVGDGTVLVEANTPQKMPEFEIDWAIQKYPSIAMESYNPMGQTIAALYYQADSNRFKARGRLKDLGEKLSVNSGYIYFEGNNSGLKVRELSCLLKAKLPRKWLAKVIDITSKDNQSFQFSNKDEYREIQTLVRKSSKNFSSCSRFKLEKYFGLVSYSWDFCITSNKHSRTATLMSGGKNILKYSILDE